MLGEGILRVFRNTADTAKKTTTTLQLMQSLAPVLVLSLSLVIFSHTHTLLSVAFFGI